MRYTGKKFQIPLSTRNSLKASNSKFQILLRPVLAIVFGYIGVLIAKGGTPADIFALGGRYFSIIAALGFGILGFIFPDILELVGRAGIAVLARQIAERIPSPASAGLRVSRFSFKRKSNNNQKYVNPLIIDTSALIDGRIVEIINTGFLYGTLLIIPSVVGELHRLADSADEIKRSKGRRGLDCLAEIQKKKKVKVVILKTDPRDEAVDDKLVKLASSLHAKLVTVDFNLNKVANLKGIEVLNANELANAARTAVLPNDELTIQINAKGREKEQGVGYLEDGTMVVVEGGAKLKGQTVEVTVMRVFQTAAGKMIFAKVV